MPTFDTPAPITVTVDLSAGDVRFVAGDRADTVVTVTPGDASDDSDVTAARRTRVEYANGVLTVRGPKIRAFDFSRRSRFVTVLVELPAGSAVHCELLSGDVHSTGVLGECRFTTSIGRFHLDRTGPLRLTTVGHVAVGTVDGAAEIATGSGNIRVGGIGGAAVIKNSNGTTDVGTVAGDLRVRSANGEISVTRADAGVDAKTSNGGVRVGRVARGAVTLLTAAGDVEVGVAAGTAVWLDLKTSHGRVHHALDDIGAAPDPRAEKTVEVRARTSFGDITVRRS